MRINKNITLKQYLYGDFDKDRVKNIDDPYPFNFNRSKWPDIHKQPNYYHKARYGGFDTKFSTVLMNIEKHNNQHSNSMEKINHANPGSQGRIKTIPSTIGKLADKGLENIHDIAGIQILTNNRKQVYDKALQIKKNYKTNPNRTDDYYKKPKNKVYYGYHIEVLNPLPVEVQIKSKTMNDFAIKTHSAYKHNKPLKIFINKGKKIFNQGF